MKFYLGTHHITWVRRTTIPLFLSFRWLAYRRSFPEPIGSWALDSGGFTQLSHYGGWDMPEPEYVDRCRYIIDGMGVKPDFVAPQDWMCEPVILRTTGLQIRDHQHATVDNFVTLRTLAPDLPIVPVLQGWTADDYSRCIDMYAEAGVDLAQERLIGLGTVCRRQNTREAETIVASLVPLRLHGFGVKTTGLSLFGDRLASADSAAWSVSGRWRDHDRQMKAGLRGKKQTARCLPHQSNPAHCLPCALSWHHHVIGGIVRGPSPMLRSAP